MMNIYVDADACPVKNEVLRVAQRHGLAVYIVSNSGMRPSADPNVHNIMVGNAFDAADDWIAGRVKPSDIVITSDILLASRCLKEEAWVLGPTGKRFSTDNI